VYVVRGIAWPAPWFKLGNAIRGLAQTVAPLAEPVTPAEIKQHCRVEVDDDDEYLSALIIGAREYVETRTGRQLLQATWQQVHDQFPAMFLLSRPPLLSVDSITYWDWDGVLRTVDPSTYLVDTLAQPGRVTPIYGQIWPFPMYRIGAVTVTFKAGYGDDPADVPERAKLAIKWLVAHWYENREAVSEASFYDVPIGVKTLLQSLSTGVYR
jgi:uncharacterized phiE125 gp8 family phage protein